MPALDLTESSHLLTKLEHELQVLAADHSDSYAAINALRDAHHPREWVWHGRLETDAALQTAIMGSSGNKDAWNIWVNQHFADFPIVRELCNGSKHFIPAKRVQATHRAGFDSPVPFFDNPLSGLDDNGFHVEVGAAQFISVADLVTRVRNFWMGLFTQFPRLG